MKNKIIILSILPAFLLGGCSAERAISFEEAQQRATFIKANQTVINDIDDLTLLYTSSYSCSSTTAGTATISNKQAVLFQLSKKNYYVHFRLSLKDSYNEEWIYVKDGKLYNLSRNGQSGSSTGTGTVENFVPNPDFQIINNQFLNLILSTYLIAFNINLENIISGKEAKADRGEMMNVKYYSSKEDDLRFNTVSIKENSPYSEEGMSGTATGSSSLNILWLHSDPSLYENYSEYTVKVEEDTDVATYIVKSQTTINAQYTGTLIDYPDLTTFDIENKVN